MRMLTLTHFVGLLYCLSVGVESIEGSVELPVYAQPPSTLSFLYQRLLSSMTEFTICFKLDAEETQPGTTSTLFGIAVDSSGSDWGISFTDSEIYAYNVYEEKKVLYTNPNGTILSMLIGWHTHCFTWKSSGNISWYSDQTEAGRVDLQGTEQSHSTPSELVPDPTITMLQHHYIHFGSVVENETTTGNITWTNMWDYEMSAEEISGLGCGAQGNVIDEASLSSRNLNAEYTLICEDQSVTTTTTTPSTTTTTTPSMTTTTTTTTTTPSMTTTTTTPSMTTATTTTTESDTSTTIEYTSTATKKRSTTPNFRPRPPSKYNNTPCETSSKFYGICQINNMECHNGTYTDGLCRRPINKGQIPSDGGVIYRSCCIEGQATGYEPRGDNF